jgi:iron complex outermembrane receptor protein
MPNWGGFMKVYFLTTVAALPVLLCPAAAFAQGASEDQAGEFAGATEAQAEEGNGTIIVTATRREESLQEVPVAVTAVSTEALTTSGVEQVRSLNQLVPGFNGGRNQNVMQPSIRGVGSSGTSVGDESNVAVYVDGVYQGDPYSTQIDLVEVSRVEVLRGPQGTVFGRNATGGLVNVVTPDPQFAPRAWVRGHPRLCNRRVDRLDRCRSGGTVPKSRWIRD